MPLMNTVLLADQLNPRSLNLIVIQYTNMNLIFGVGSALDDVPNSSM